MTLPGEKILKGQGTIKSNLFKNIENNHWERSGNVVSYSFVITSNGTSWSGYTTELITGLPKAKTDTRFLGINANTNKILNFKITADGKIINWYNNTLPENNHIVVGQITYIAQ